MSPRTRLEDALKGGEERLEKKVRKKQDEARQHREAGRTAAAESFLAHLPPPGGATRQPIGVPAGYRARNLSSDTRSILETVERGGVAPRYFEEHV